mmetsp:Transcript_136464/g.236778  ORF Transcript_136464/g.236778 Transcript_136464/m.236778 type:complete len:373 (-) Transcript_136464:25-1143(-)
MPLGRVSAMVGTKLCRKKRPPKSRVRQKTSLQLQGVALWLSKPWPLARKSQPLPELPAGRVVHSHRLPGMPSTAIYPWVPPAVPPSPWAAPTPADRLSSRSSSSPLSYVQSTPPCSCSCPSTLLSSLKVVEGVPGVMIPRAPAAAGLPGRRWAQRPPRPLLRLMGALTKPMARLTSNAACCLIFRSSRIFLDTSHIRSLRSSSSLRRRSRSSCACCSLFRRSCAEPVDNRLPVLSASSSWSRCRFRSATSASVGRLREPSGGSARPSVAAARFLSGGSASPSAAAARFLSDISATVARRRSTLSTEAAVRARLVPPGGGGSGSSEARERPRRQPPAVDGWAGAALAWAGVRELREVSEAVLPLAGVAGPPRG